MSSSYLTIHSEVVGGGISISMDAFLRFKYTELPAYTQAPMLDMTRVNHRWRKLSCQRCVSVSLRAIKH